DEAFLLLLDSKLRSHNEIVKFHALFSAGAASTTATAAPRPRGQERSRRGGTRRPAPARHTQEAWSQAEKRARCGGAWTCASCRRSRCCCCTACGKANASREECPCGRSCS